MHLRHQIHATMNDAPHPASRIPRPAPSRRFPAEWERHAATWIGWPHHRPDWPGKFEPIPWVYAEIVRVLHEHERVEGLCDDEAVREEARAARLAHGGIRDRVGLHGAGAGRVLLG